MALRACVAVLAVCLGVDSAYAARPLSLDKQARAEAGNRIVGGEVADIQEAPYQVSLRYLNSHICGGALIDPCYVVTASHCVDGREADTLSIRAGSDCRVRGGQLVNVSQIAMHPDFDAATLDHDVAVLELGECVTHPDAAPVALATETPPDGCNVTISGWGTMMEGSYWSPIFLRKAYVQKVSDADCKQAYGEDAITCTMAAYGTPEGGVDSCQGDSGGPAVHNDTLAALVSWGYGCTENPNAMSIASIGAIQKHCT